METLLGEIEALADPNARAKAAEVVQLLLSSTARVWRE